MFGEIHFTINTSASMMVKVVMFVVGRIDLVAHFSLGAPEKQLMIHGQLAKMVPVNKLTTRNVLMNASRAEYQVKSAPGIKFHSV